MASRVRVRVLNSVDLPTLGRPTSATIGSTGRSAAGPVFRCGCRRPCGRGVGRAGGRTIGTDDTAVIQQQHHAVRVDRRLCVTDLAGTYPADDGPGGLV